MSLSLKQSGEKDLKVRVTKRDLEDLLSAG